MEVMEEYTLEECTVWMEGLDLCRNCPDEREGNTVHPDGYGCYIKRPLQTRCSMNDRDKLREEIAIIIHEGFRSDVKAGAMADDVLSLLAPVFEKAEKWDAYQAELAKEKAHTDRFISLMDAEEDELRRDAGLWWKVKEIASSRHLIACADCPVTKQCRNGVEGLCSSVYKLVAALSEVPHGK